VASDSAKSQPLADRALSGRLVLVADDNDINLELMRSLLSLKGARVLTATNGRDALDLALKHPVDLIFMDIHMPELDGLEALAALRARSRRHIPVIALTADAAPQNQAAIKNARFDGSLIKPLQDADLREIVVDVLTRPANKSWSGPRTTGPLIQAEPVSLPSRDPEQALRIAGGSQAIADKLFQALLDELPDSIAAIRRASEFGQWEELWQRAHRLHGSAAVCGVPAFKALLSRLEGVIKRRASIETGTLLTQLQAEAKALQAIAAKEEPTN
jgi:two-component system sensor histidine kinase BarA